MEPREDLLSVLHPAADDLVAAVHALDADGVERALARAHVDYDGAGEALHALLVLLAGAVPEDAPVAQHAVWAADPDRYRRMRRAGLMPALACQHMVQMTDLGGAAP